MRIEVDRELCAGSATCTGFVPTAFKIGRDGKAALLIEDAAQLDADALADAVANCPFEAITLTEAG
ncbi:ferredoxin [Nonomuraea sp. MG754425]|uniref:ferredoxin n=1 Tax=Nonomuraea sp. MG754425 TaxID=2570319 RepID=UPI001F28E9F8|nr:ferredoxin [Nonomuraea sp. MG754425]MCF6476404.1 ferredoxin [Nonomuraea sp. MG754425]